MVTNMLHTNKTLLIILTISTFIISSFFFSQASAISDDLKSFGKGLAGDALKIVVEKLTDKALGNEQSSTQNNMNGLPYQNPESYPDTSYQNPESYPDTPYQNPESYPDTPYQNPESYPDTPYQNPEPYPDTPYQNPEPYPDTPYQNSDQFVNSYLETMKMYWAQVNLELEQLPQYQQQPWISYIQSNVMQILSLFSPEQQEVILNIFKQTMPQELAQKVLY